VNQDEPGKMKARMPEKIDAWPELPLAAWQDTYATLHMWTQIVGHIRMTLTPKINHWWNVPLYVSARGLTTSPIPYERRIFEIRFDFIAHKLIIETSEGGVDGVQLAPRSVADFYSDLMRRLHSLEIDVKFHGSPDEVPNPIPFAQDEVHKSYDAEYAHRWWRALVSADTVLKDFRSRFIGKCSPVHFFWGSFDLAVTRFSGRRAPARSDPMSREAYSHEVSSVGFWPGGGDVKGPAFYSYSVPQPDGFKTYAVRPATAKYDAGLGEFLLMYDDIRTAASPEAELMEFCQSTYEAGANLGKWDRAELERAPSDAA
jgi:Family of unknown function (DUF5996)